MADTKISALTAATTPLDGTEVLPIVQSGATVKVANNNLRPKQIQSNATSGVLQVVGPAAAATRVMTTPDANFTVARTDAAQSFTGDQTLSTGNLIIGTSGKGIDFSATPGTGTSELFADYEEGTWTPTVTAASGSITTVSATGNYTKIGRQVTVNINIVITTNGTGASALLIGNVPFNASTIRYDAGVGREYEITGNAVAMTFSATTTLQMLTYNNTYPGGNGYKIAASISYNT
jgi:hypothetical protein